MKKLLLVPTFVLFQSMTITSALSSTSELTKPQRPSLYCSDYFGGDELKIIWAEEGTRLAGYINIFLYGEDVAHHKKTKWPLAHYLGKPHIETEPNSLFLHETYDLRLIDNDFNQVSDVGQIIIAKVRKNIGRAGISFEHDDVISLPISFETHAYLNLSDGTQYDFTCYEKTVL